jgi:hypothetical protein
MFDYEEWYHSLKGIRVRDMQDRELYDPLPMARFCPLPMWLLRIVYQLSVKKRECIRKAIKCELDESEEAERARASEYLQQQLFGNGREAYKYFFRLSNMSPKDVVMHLMAPPASGDEVVARLISRYCILATHAQARALR